MAKILGHTLTHTQTQAAIVSAAVGIALLAVAVAGMRRAAATGANASGDQLNVAFKQGYNTGAADAETKRPGPWDSLPTGSPFAALIAALTPTASSSVAAATTAVTATPAPARGAAATTVTMPAPAPISAPSRITADLFVRQPSGAVGVIPAGAVVQTFLVNGVSVPVSLAAAPRGI